MKKEKEFNKFRQESPLPSASNTVNLNADIHRIKQKMGETGQAISQTASHAKNKTGEFLSDTVQTVKEKSLDLEHMISGYIKENPYKSMGIGLLTGLALTMLLRIRNKKSE